jgi:hypothetical protein
MTPQFRTLALAAMSLAATVPVQAAATNFEDLAMRALGTDVAKPLGSPLRLTNQISGFSFTGATVYHVDQTTGGDYANVGYPKPARKAKNGVGFIQNRDGANLKTIDQTISVQLAGALVNDDIEAISFDLAAGANTVLNVWAFGKDANGANTQRDFGGISGSRAWAWRSLPVSSELDGLASLGTINRIEFVVQTINNFIPAFALDNLSFRLAGTGGAAVPEPAALGLVAMALAAAGATTRKRRT